MISRPIELIDSLKIHFENLELNGGNSQEWKEVHRKLSRLSMLVEEMEKRIESLEGKNESSLLSGECSLYIPVDHLPQRVTERAKELASPEETLLDEPPPLLEDDIEIPEERKAPNASCSAKVTKRLKPLSPPPAPLTPPVSMASTQKKFKVRSEWISIEEAEEIFKLHKTILEAICRDQGVEFRLVDSKRFYSMRQVENGVKNFQIANERKKTAQVVMDPMDQNLQNELKHDAELRELISGTHVTEEYRFIERNGECFIQNTGNGNYNAIHLIAVLADRFADPVSQKTIRRVVKLLERRAFLLEEAIRLATRHLNDSYLVAILRDPKTSEDIKSKLLKDDLLGRYYADLALFRIAISAQSQTPLPETPETLLPKDILEVANSVKWPPSEKDREKRENLKNFNPLQKVLYVLQRLVENNPVEFDLKKSNS